MFSLQFKSNSATYSYYKAVLVSLRDPKNIYDSLIPLHLITKCVGLSPYTLDIANGKPRYESSTLGSLYSLAIMLMFVGYYTYAVENRDTDEDANKIVRGIDMYHEYGSIVVMSSCIILSSYHQRPLIQAIKSLDEVDMNTSGYVARINWCGTRNFLFGYFVAVMVLLGSCEYMNCTMFLRQVETLSTYCLLMCYIPMVINSFMEAQFVSYILLLKQRFSILNNELRSVLSKRKYRSGTNTAKVDIIANKKEPMPVFKKLTEIRRLHSQLCEVGVLFNRSYSLQLLLNIGNMFIAFTTLAYYCFDGCMKLYLKEDSSNLYNTITTGIWTVVKLSQLLILSLTCSLVQKEVKLAGEIIYTIENRYNPELSSEVYSFGKQIIHWNFRFTAFSCFDIDMTLFYSAISSATTYLMILLQLDIANKQIEKSMEDAQADLLAI